MSTTDRLPAIWVIALAQSIFYCSLWIWNEYIASLLTIIFSAIIFVVLILATLAEWVEPSRIAGWYYRTMIISVIMPWIIAALIYWMYDGQIDFL